MIEIQAASVDAVTCFAASEPNGHTLQTAENVPKDNSLSTVVGSNKWFRWPCNKPADSMEQSSCTDDSDDEPELKAFNPEDYEYTMFLQFVDPEVEKEYLKNAKIKVPRLFYFEKRIDS
jgi:hypothetical protein